MGEEAKRTEMKLAAGLQDSLNITFDELFKSGVELSTLTFEDTAQSRIFYHVLEIAAGHRKPLQWCLIDTISNFILVRFVDYWVPHPTFTNFMFLEFHVSPYQMLQIPYLSCKGL